MIAVLIQDETLIDADALTIEIEVVHANDLMAEGIPLLVEVAFSFDHIGKSGMAACDWMDEPGMSRHCDVEVLGIDHDVMHRPLAPVHFAADYSDLYASIQ